MGVDDAAFAALHKPSDLRVRTLSAIVMVAVAGTALVLRGWVWTAFVGLLAAGVLWEWVKLSSAIARGAVARMVWIAAGICYIGLAAQLLWSMATGKLLIIILCVIATDIGAYFSGRRFGGPKIAPRISPSKTWAGLGGGMLAAGAVFWGLRAWTGWQMALGDAALVPALPVPATIAAMALIGALIAIVAQAGDFFESWMKRRAGVKDSGKLIPGHGGLFDRVDGLLAVLAFAGLVTRVGRLA